MPYICVNEIINNNLKIKIMDLVQLFEDAIAGEYGHSVSSQFKDSYEDNDFEDQNYNALKLVFDYLNKARDAQLLEDIKAIELLDYMDDLKDYLNHNN